jgi:hypothetical protein
MTILVWDQAGERIYQTGVDRGVLFLPDGTVVPWNGLTSVEDNTSKETNAIYLDGFKYLEYISPGDFSAILKAFTYPEEFDSVNGILRFTPGLRVHDQPPKNFSLSYRTKIGDDISGIDAGYLIHLIYNVLANPDSQESATISDSPTPSEFSWALSARPIRESVSWRPTAHVSINSRDISSELLQTFEDVIYGTTEVDPRLPAISEVPTLLGYV